MKRKKLKKCNRGFSLIELIIVIAIMAVLVGILAPNYIGWVDKAKRRTELYNAHEIMKAMQVASITDSLEEFRKIESNPAYLFMFEYHWSIFDGYDDTTEAIEHYVSLYPNEHRGYLRSWISIIGRYHSALGDEWGVVLSINPFTGEPEILAEVNMDTREMYELYPNPDKFLNGETINMGEYLQKSFEAASKR